MAHKLGLLGGRESVGTGLVPTQLATDGVVPSF